MSPSAIGSLTNSKATSYLLVIDLLKGSFKIQDRDDLHEIREKATGKLLTLDESLKPTLSPLLAWAAKTLLMYSS